MVDLRSDTVTRPTPAMLEALVAAEVGDDVLGDDPTVNRLQDRCAALAGKEAALFVPSGTMGNQIAIRCWTEPGDEVLMEASAHPFHYETAGAAAISGVQVHTVPGERGQLEVADVAAAIRPDAPWYARTSLLTLENTSNRGGGSVYPQERLDALTALAHERGLRVHLDGARVFNAVVASGTSLGRMARGMDSVTFCLSKGLGAPVGSVLCGPAGMIHKATRVRKLLGGAMRQAGYLAACGLYALDHNVDRLADDHVRARALYEGLSELGYTCREPETNMLYVDHPDAAGAMASLAERGVACIAVSPTSLRLVVHLDIDDAGVEAALAAFAALRG